MYKTILLTLDGKPTDRAMIEHVTQLARFVHSRVVASPTVGPRAHGSDAVSPRLPKTRTDNNILAEFRSADSAEAGTGVAIRPQIVNGFNKRGATWWR